MIVGDLLIMIPRGGRQTSCYIRTSPDLGFGHIGEIRPGSLVVFLDETVDDDVVWIRCLTHLGDGWVPSPYFQKA